MTATTAARCHLEDFAQVLEPAAIRAEPGDCKGRAAAASLAFGVAEKEGAAGREIPREGNVQKPPLPRNGHLGQAADALDLPSAPGSDHRRVP